MSLHAMTRPVDAARQPPRDPLADYPIPLTRQEAQRDLPFGQRAVIVHQGEHWPTGALCRNCGGAWPCPLNRWGMAVLWMAGLSAADIQSLLECAAQGNLPWVRRAPAGRS